jgi:hypothetical protein
MASMVLKMSVVMDGYVAPAAGSGDWIAAAGSEDAVSWNVGTVSKAGAHLMGATYAGIAAHCPSDSGPFAQSMNEISKTEPCETSVGACVDRNPQSATWMRPSLPGRAGGSPCSLAAGASSSTSPPAPARSTASPSKIGSIARAALVLTHFEHGYIT